MPGRTGGELTLFQQNHIGLVIARQVISGRASDNSSANDNNLRAFGQFHDFVFPCDRL